MAIHDGPGGLDLGTGHSHQGEVSAFVSIPLLARDSLPFDDVEFSAKTEEPDATRALAAALAGFLKSGDLVVLTGHMGAGKTCFTQGLACGLGVEGRVTSPTFTLANSYDGRLVLNHLDVYRLDDPSETLDLDLPDMLESGVTVIEWGTQIDAVLPSERLEVEIRWPESGGDDQRLVTLRTVGADWDDRFGGLASGLHDWVQQC